MLIAGAPAAPLIMGPALYALAALTIVLGAIFGLGMYWLWERTFGPLLRGIAHNINVPIPTPFGTKHPLGGTARAILRAEKRIAQSFLNTWLGSNRAAAAMMGAAAFVFNWTAREIADLAGAVTGAHARLLQVDLPAIRADSVGQAVAESAGRARGRFERQDNQIARQGGEFELFRRRFMDELQRLSRGIDRVRSRDIPRVEAKADAAGRTATRTKARVESRSWWKTHVKEIGGTAFFAAAVGTALGRLGLRWLRCGNVRRTGRWLCGIPGDLLEMLLGAALIYFTITDLCRMVGWIQRAAEEFEPLLYAFVNEVGGLICGGKASAPTGIVEHDWAKVARLPTGIVPGDLDPLPKNVTAA